ncbi:unnamed protein product [Blepharisma stoltei]|uniref:NADH dehydrogenase subunit 6 n=1 Tax=Blepharisma stoltei TaxID=1481888 RepID=A0AAU9JTN7_9CILI|nr:unnamed protein product [Blepharisma stoltei]
MFSGVWAELVVIASCCHAAFAAWAIVGMVTAWGTLAIVSIIITIWYSACILASSIIYILIKTPTVAISTKIVII